MNVDMYKGILETTQEDGQGEGPSFFAVDNNNDTELEMSKIRDKIEKIMKERFVQVSLPASWLMLRIVLHLMNKDVVTLPQCEEIARRLSMPTPVQQALLFFHHNIGSLLYYGDDIPSVRDLVICTPQAVFKSLTTIIFDKFKNYGTPRKVREKFEKTGLFSFSDISEIAESTPLSPKQLVHLLKHNGILAVVKCNEEEASSHCESEYIIPAVLKMALEKDLKPESPCDASPLIIHFEGGFVPFGVFSASIARLIAREDSLSPKWRLDRKEVKKNKVKFLVAKAFIVTLVSRPQYLEIQMKRYPGAKHGHELSEICSIVRQTVVENLDNVISKMTYRPHASIATSFSSSQHRFHLAFTCCLKDHNDHLMKVENEQYGECLSDGAETDLYREHLLWFNKVSECACTTYLCGILCTIIILDYRINFHHSQKLLPCHSQVCPQPAQVSLITMPVCSMELVIFIAHLAGNKCFNVCTRMMQ